MRIDWRRFMRSYHLCRRSMGVRASLRAAWRANGYNEPGR
jgi:hypothetical protein